MKTYSIECSGEVHRIGLDDEGVLQLLDHDIEEEEASCMMGDKGSNCYRVLNGVKRNPIKWMMVAVANDWDEIERLCIDLGAGPYEWKKS